MRNRSYSIASSIIMLSLTAAFVACGPQNKMKTINPTKIFGDKSSSEEQLNKEIIGAATRKFDKDASNPSTKSTASSAKPSNGTETQELASRIKYLNVKNVGGKLYLEVALTDVSGELFDLVFLKSTPVVYKVSADGTPSNEEGKLTVPVKASSYKDQNGLLIVTLSEDSKTVNAIIRTSGASVKLQQGQAETDDSKKLNNSSITVRMVQLYYISEATRQANQIIPVSSPANKIFVQTGDQTKGLLLKGDLPAADAIATLNVQSTSELPADEDLKKIIADYELNIQSRGLLLQANSFQLLLTGKDSKAGQVLGFDVSLVKRLPDEVVVGKDDEPKTDEQKATDLSLPPVGEKAPSADAPAAPTPSADVSAPKAADDTIAKNGFEGTSNDANKATVQSGGDSDFSLKKLLPSIIPFNN